MNGIFNSIAILAAAAAPAAAPEPGPDGALASASVDARSRDFDLKRLLGRGDVGLTPEAAVARAFEVAPELREAAARVQAARAEVRSARVPLAPRLGVAAFAERIGGFPAGVIATPAGEVSIEVPRNRAGVSAELSYPLTRVFWGVLPKLRSAHAREEAEAFRARSTREELALLTLEGYWALAEARGGLAVAGAALDQARAQRARVEAMANAGLATPADLAAAQAREAEAVQTVVRAEGALDVARGTLALLLDRPEAQVVAFPTDLLEPPGPSVATASELDARAEASRPELLALDAALRATTDQRRALWSDRLPQLDVSAEATYAQPNPYVIPPQEAFDPSWSVGARLSWSPNAWWDAEQVDDRVDADRARLEGERARTLRTVRIQIRSELSRLESARRAWAAAGARARAAEEAYAARTAAFESGQAIFAEVLEADAELSAARQSELDALVDARLARARLDRAVGVLTTP